MIDPAGKHTARNIRVACYAVVIIESKWKIRSDRRCPVALVMIHFCQVSLQARQGFPLSYGSGRTSCHGQAKFFFA